MQATVDVIVPCYMKASQIEETLCRVIEILDEAELVFHLIVVMDGPDADCVRNIDKIQDNRIQTIVLPFNQGKGSAIRAGFKECDADFVAFFDADLDLHPDAIVDAVVMLSNLDNSTVVGVYGSKFHDDSEVVYPLTRRLASRIYRQLIKFVFGLDVDDTQTGIKVFKLAALGNTIVHTTEDRFLFDVELMAICNAFGYKMVPTPVILDYQYSSSINLFSALRMIADTVKLGWRFRRTK